MKLTILPQLLFVRPARPSFVHETIRKADHPGPVDVHPLYSFPFPRVSLNMPFVTLTTTSPKHPQTSLVPLAPDLPLKGV